MHRAGDLAVQNDFSSSTAKIDQMVPKIQDNLRSYLGSYMSLGIVKLIFSVCEHVKHIHTGPSLEKFTVLCRGAVFIMSYALIIK